MNPTGGCRYSSASADARAENLSTPLNGTLTAKVDIDSGSGNLTIDRLPAGEEAVLASCSLEYFKKQGRPTGSVNSESDHATLTLRGRDSGRPWFRFPWAVCNGATEWRVHVNPRVASEISAHTGGGNVKLNLADMTVTGVSADTGGGNMEVVLPDHAANLRVAAKTGAGNIAVEIGSDTTGNNTINANSGAGNVVVRVPRGMPARVHATSGLGKVIVEPGFAKIDDHTYQSPDYERAVNTVEITAKSGAGNVSVSAR
jgi:Cell wall-active antibiotics response 4TMS YvqF